MTRDTRHDNGHDIGQEIRQKRSETRQETRGMRQDTLANLTRHNSPPDKRQEARQWTRDKTK